MISPPPQWRIRPATEEDRDFLERLAPRLTVGLATWRDPDAMEATARRWLLENLERMGPDSTVFIAEALDGVPVGAATIQRSQHFTGAPQADLGELAVISSIEGRGAASALLAAAESWARERGLPFVALATGAANARARAFYARHGYLKEDIRLAKRV
jgi:GNAT superfamily N-acetyltransferase